MAGWSPVRPAAAYDEPMAHDGPMGLPDGDPACAFCAIVAGRARASRVYEDARVLAFLDIHPASPGDLLVIPKAHATSLEDIDQALTPACSGPSACWRGRCGARGCRARG
jgi:HIT domain